MNEEHRLILEGINILLGKFSSGEKDMMFRIKVSKYLIDTEEKEKPKEFKPRIKKALSENWNKMKDIKISLRTLCFVLVGMFGTLSLLSQPEIAQAIMFPMIGGLLGYYFSNDKKVFTEN